MRHRRIRPVFLWCLAAAVSVAVLWCVVGPIIRSWRVEYAIRRLEKRPSQAHAGVLVELLQTHAPSDEQGSRALALLLRPKFTMRKTYAVGQQVVVSMERPFALDFRNVIWHEEAISIDGRQGGAFSNLGRLDEKPQLRLLGAYTEPGTYRVDIRCQHALGIERTSAGAGLSGRLRKALSRLMSHAGCWQPARTYQCDFTTSTEIVIVPEQEAEKVEMASSPELDEAVRAAFQMGDAGFQGRYSTATDKWTADGHGQIVYRDIPIDVAFTIALQLPDGREIAGRHGRRRRLDARAGTSGTVRVFTSDFMLDEPGRYDATLVLVPDPDYAWMDPTIKTIWGGTLEFPISFRIDADANEPGR